MGRWGYRRGRSLDARLEQGFTNAPDQKPSVTKGHVWLMGVSLVLVLLAIGCLAAGVWVWSRDWPVGLKVLGSLPLLGVVAALLPRPLRIPKGDLIPENQGRELRRLVADVAKAAGTPVPDSMMIFMDLNAAVARYGWRQRSVMLIGAPMWLILSPDARLSVLAHEFGHLSNNDPMRSTLTLPARTFGARAVAATGGRNPWRRAVSGADSLAWDGGGVLGALVHMVLALVNTVAATLQLTVDYVAMPDSRRAEFLADLTSRKVAGSDAFIDSSHELLLAPLVWQDLWDRAPRITPEQLPEAIAESLRARSRELGIRRQSTLRTNDVWSTHPAESDRIALIESLPRVEGTLHIEPERWAQIDAELAAWTNRIHRSLLGTRESF